MEKKIGEDKSIGEQPSSPEKSSHSHKLTNRPAAWDSKRDMLVKSGAFAIEQSSEAVPATASPSKLPDELPQNTLLLCAEQLSGSYDSEYGGFGSAPKFPRPVENQLMLYWSKKMKHTGKFQEANEALKMVLFSLQCLARGGIHEHVGCGFHRYSVDKFRHVPHFEKMLYDQGQIASLYLSSFSITTDVFYSCVSWDIFDYLRRKVIGQEGEIFSAEDADSAEYEGTSRKKEGAFCVWTSKEVDGILGQHATIFKNHFYIKPMANRALSRMSDPHHEFQGKNVLFGRHNPAEMTSKLGMPLEQYLDILGECRKKAFEVRSSRPRPHLDDKHPNAGGGLAFLWKNTINLEVINYTANHVLAVVTEDDGFRWFLTCFYGWPEAQQKEKSWRLLEYLRTFVEGPWMLIGDFNAFLHTSEKKSIRPPQTSQVNAFREALESCHLKDLGFKGYPFTWNNKRPGETNTKIRLDRGVANEAWIGKFPLSRIVHLSAHASDHLPLLLQVQSFDHQRQRRERSFKFEESWLLLDDCEDTVNEVWGRDLSATHGLKFIKQKIQMCGAELLRWGLARTDLDAEEIKKIQKRLD
ncbi:hypothetical protein SO802_013620 [Lithocarpus litseifolius]|uniref:Endonuclease/exonuclease/phosphatase domain-containing protein n=1 Tax=Lithocarpus litseifolius TaxID=425828 RepID=A0AAW2D707_9ROSI